MRAWLLWRTNKDESKKWIARCNELLETIPNQPENETPLHANFETWKKGVSALMVDLSGDWKYAILDYLSMDLPVGAALAAVQLGDWLSNREDQIGALHWYEQAREIWRNTPSDNDGSAISLFRQAEVYWRTHNDLAAQQALEKARQAVENSPRSLQITAHSAIKRGLALVGEARGSSDDQGSSGEGKYSKRAGRRWPSFNWQAYDDDFRIAVLFYPYAIRISPAE